MISSVSVAHSDSSYLNGAFMHAADVCSELFAKGHKMLGHWSLEMTQRDANLMTEDLQAVHQRLSLLG